VTPRGLSAAVSPRGVLAEVRIVPLREIVPVVRSTAFVAGQGTFDNCLGDADEGAGLKEPPASEAGVERGQLGVNGGDGCEGGAQARFVAEEPGVAPHGLAQLGDRGLHGIAIDEAERLLTRREWHQWQEREV